MATAVGTPAARSVSTNARPYPPPVARLVSVDVLRGLVMVIMALDHVRDFMTFQRSSPEDLAHTSGALFFTRVITHFCAPVFAFLAGTGHSSPLAAESQYQRSRASFLTRGLWLRSLS